MERCDHSTLHQGSFTFPFSILARAWPWITRINVPVVAVPCVILVQPAYVYLCTYTRGIKLSTDVCVEHVYARSLINIGSIFCETIEKSFLARQFCSTIHLLTDVLIWITRHFIEMRIQPTRWTFTRLNNITSFQMYTCRNFVEIRAVGKTVVTSKDSGRLLWLIALIFNYCWNHVRRQFR